MNSRVQALAIYDDKVIAGGAFTTADGDSAMRIAAWDGSSWSPLGSGIGTESYPYIDIEINALMVHNDRLIVGGSYISAGSKVSAFLAQWTKHGPTAVGDDETLPLEIALHPNYPNPFNAFTKITYSLRQPGAVTLTIYDVLGRHVATLVEGVQETGDHSVAWNGTNDHGREAGSGVYFYRLTVGGKSMVKKMMMLK